MELKQKLIDLEKRMSTVEQTVGIKPLRTEDTYIPGYSEPEFDDIFFTIAVVKKQFLTLCVCSRVWYNTTEDQLASLAGWVFRTQEEAEDKLECMKAYSEYIKAIQKENKRTGFKPNFNRNIPQANWKFVLEGEKCQLDTFPFHGRRDHWLYEYMAQESLKIIKEQLGEETIIKALRN